MSDIEIENNTATLGRVIFYDQNMSFNRTVSCASCHKQTNGFADDKAFSEGFDGALTHRNTLSITDFRTSLYPGLFWDDRSKDIREATILPLLDSEEMGMTLSEIIGRMEKTDYYPDLFNKAYGTNKITNDKIAEALSQFIVSISSYESKLDQSFDNYFEGLTYSEKRGISIFEELCADCHSGILPKFVIDNFLDSDLFFRFLTFRGPHNTGSDLVLEDLGVANTTGNTEDEGKFKTPNLKNVALTAPYMHDGRFETLEEVIDFYSEGLLPHPNSTFLNASRYQQAGTPSEPFAGFKFDEEEKSSLLAFLKTLTDEKMITNPMFSDPFVKVISSVEDIKEVDQFKVYPNPFSSKLNVNFNNDKAALATVKLFDLNGQLIKHSVTTRSTYVLERGNLPAGTYIIELLLDDKTSNTKIVAK